eukprot:5305636-Pyramimonas_sp.AAC.1
MFVLDGRVGRAPPRRARSTDQSEGAKRSYTIPGRVTVGFSGADSACCRCVEFSLLENLILLLQGLTP